MIKLFDCLAQKTDVLGPHFLEASAGTGKTFAIEHVLIRLLIEGLALDQILVVTFTKAAARELKHRIRLNIERALVFLKKEKAEFFFDYLIPFFKEKKETIKKLQEALYLFDQAQIFTIHGFCYNVLSRYAFEAQANFSLSEEEGSYKNILKREILDYFKYFIDPEEVSSFQLSLFFKKNPDLSLLVNKIINFSTSSDESLSFQKQHQKFQDTLFLYEKGLEEFFLPQVLAEFDLLKLNYLKGKNFSEEGYKNQIALLAKILEEKKCSQEIFEQILQTKLSLFNFLNDNNLKKRSQNKKITKSYFFHFCEKFLFKIVQETVDEEKIFQSIAIKALSKARKKLQEEDLYTFDDILLKMKESLKEKEFLKKIQALYKAVIVDEFQDTDPVQWDIFETIGFKNTENLKAFYLVGDPKQSIYSFRKADLYTYFRAKNSFEKNAHFLLNTNYRTCPKLMASLNFFFSKEFASDWITLPKIKKSFPYLSVEAGLVAQEEILKENPLTFFLAWKKESFNQLEYNLFYPYLVKEIEFLHHKKQLKYEKIAVLVKDRYQAERVRQYLIKRGLPAHSYCTHSLVNSEAYRALKDLLCATIFCNDLNKIKIALAGPFIRCSDHELLNLELDSAFLEFAKLNDLLHKKGLCSFFKSFFQSSWLNKTTMVYEQIINKEDLSLYLNIMQLIEIFLEKEKKEKLTNETILAFFEELTSLDPEDIAIKPLVDIEAIQIMTIHMSKGLEFEVVFALGLANKSSQTNKEEAFLKEINAEQLRQLYVAMTRAKKKLYVPYLLEERQKDFDFSSCSSIELFFKQTCALSDSFTSEYVLKKLSSLQEKNLAFYHILQPTKEALKPSLKGFETINLRAPKKNIFLSQPKSYLFSFSSLSSSKKPETLFLKEQAEEILFSSKKITPSTDFGIFIHKIFKKIFSKEKNNGLKKEALLRLLEKDDFENKYNKELLYEMIFRVLNTPLSEKAFLLKDIDFENVFVETEFLYLVDQQNHFLKGFTDMIFYHEDKFYLIDWKSNWLGDEYQDYALENMQKYMEENQYFLQAAIYAKALKKYLKIIDPRPFEEIFGGAFYFFLRGLLINNPTQGIYHFFPDLSLAEDPFFKK